MKKGLAILAALLLLAGCGKQAAVTTTNDTTNPKATQATKEASGDSSSGDTAGNEATEGFSFTVSGVKVPMNADAAPIVKALGDPKEYFESESCAFKGLDKVYTYGGFELDTYPKDDKDYISSVYFLDDSVTTDKDIYLGSSLDEVLAAYGKDYTEQSGEYTYTLGQSKLSFLVEEDSVTSITYSAVVEGLDN